MYRSRTVFGSGPNDDDQGPPAPHHAHHRARCHFTLKGISHGAPKVTCYFTLLLLGLLSKLSENKQVLGSQKVTVICTILHNLVHRVIIITLFTFQ